MVYTELAPKRQHSPGTSYATTIERCQSTIPWILIIRALKKKKKKKDTLIQNHMLMCAVSLLESRE